MNREDSVQVVKALRDIPAYSVIDGVSDLQTAVAKPHSDAITTIDYAEGRITNRAIAAGDVVDESDLVDLPGIQPGNDVVFVIPAANGTQPLAAGDRVVLYGAQKEVDGGVLVSDDAIVLAVDKDAKTVTVVVPNRDAAKVADYLGPDASIVITRTLGSRGAEPSP
ncbi:MAG: SAF domain-containing protein [Dehalococcoidia bacterium]